MDTYRGDIIRGTTRYVLWPTAKITANKAKKTSVETEKFSLGVQKEVWKTRKELKG
jgi:hypothetical protein